MIEFLNRRILFIEKLKIKKGFPLFLYNLFKIVFSPIDFLFEYLNTRMNWKLITDQIGENPDFVKFLDKNEFGLGRWKIYKKDIIEPGSDLDSFPSDKLKMMIIKEYVDELMKFMKNSSIAIEDIVSLNVSVENIKNSDDYLKLYTVELYYYRLGSYLISRRRFYKWIMIFILLVITILILNSNNIL